MASLQNICEVKVDTATIGGESVESIVSVTLTAQANGVPSVTLIVDATNPGAYKDEPQVFEGSTNRAVSTYTKFCGRRDNGDTLSLTVSVKFVVGDGDEQTLSISGWVLTDVVLAPISVGACPSVSLTCRHPLCKADNYGAIVDGTTLVPNDSAITGDNPISAFVSAIRACVAAAGGPHANPDPKVRSGPLTAEQVRAALVTQLDESATNIEQYIDTGEIPGFPCAKALGDLAGFAARSFRAYADTTTGALRTVLTSIAPECSIVVGGDYTQTQLKAMPFTPWKRPTASILETDIVTLGLPGSDTVPIAGAHLEAAAQRNGMANSFHLDSASAGLKPIPAFYVPRRQISNPTRVGAIQTFQIPAWISRISACAAGKSAAGMSVPKAEAEGNLTTGINFSGGKPNVSKGGSGNIAGSLGAAMMTLARAYYETFFMSDLTFSVTTRFMTKAGGEALCPGITLRIDATNAAAGGESASAASELVSGYVMSVSHSIDIRRRTAETTVMMSYPVFGGVVPPEIVNPEMNALYSGD